MCFKKIQMVIEIEVEERIKIRMAALKSGKTMREWVLEACREKIKKEEEAEAEAGK